MACRGLKRTPIASMENQRFLGTFRFYGTEKVSKNWREEYEETV